MGERGQYSNITKFIVVGTVIVSLLGVAWIYFTVPIETTTGPNTLRLTAWTNVAPDNPADGVFQASYTLLNPGTRNINLQSIQLEPAQPGASLGEAYIEQDGKKISLRIDHKKDLVLFEGFQFPAKTTLMIIVRSKLEDLDSKPIDIEGPAHRQLWLRYRQLGRQKHMTFNLN